jgi:GrpB-like predicted nucleotidyltransferase (UPF0157 family)
MEIVEPDRRWPRLYAAEARRLMEAYAPPLVRIEHIGSTAVPGLAAKPVIDMMASVGALAEVAAIGPGLGSDGYGLVDTGMRGRLLYRRDGQPAWHLHVVEEATFAQRKERWMRDELIADPQALADYAALKRVLAVLHRDEAEAYTQAKTAFVQALMDRICDRKGIPRIDVWED